MGADESQPLRLSKIPCGAFRQKFTVCCAHSLCAGDAQLAHLQPEKNKSKADNRRLEDIADVALCVFIVLEEMGVNCSQVIHEARERNKYLTIEDKNDLWEGFKNGI